MQEGFVDAHSVLIYYKIIGHGAPLMLVHGGPGASHDYLLPYLLPLYIEKVTDFLQDKM
jgi:proline iminopeptidase